MDATFTSSPNKANKTNHEVAVKIGLQKLIYIILDGDIDKKHTLIIYSSGS